MKESRTYFKGAQEGISPWVGQFCKYTNKLPSFDNCGVHFPVGKMFYWVGSFGQWAG